jgi:hypothetical protein
MAFSPLLPLPRAFLPPPLQEWHWRGALEPPLVQQKERQQPREFQQQPREQCWQSRECRQSREQWEREQRWQSEQQRQMQQRERRWQMQQRKRRWQMQQREPCQFDGQGKEGCRAEIPASDHSERSNERQKESRHKRKVSTAVSE